MGVCYSTTQSWLLHGNEAAVFVRMPAGWRDTCRTNPRRVLATRPVSVETPGGDVVASLDVPEIFTVVQMKTMLAGKIGTSAYDQHLLHGSNMLVEGELRQLGVASGAVVTLIQTPKTFVLTASEDGTAKLWNVDEATCAHNLEGHEGFICSAVLSGNGM